MPFAMGAPSSGGSRFYEQICENLPIGVAIIRDGRFEFMNKVLSDLLGIGNCTPGSLRDFDAAGLLHPDDKAKILNSYMDLLEGRNKGGEYHFRLLRRDGSSISVQSHSSLVTHDGKPAILVAVLDVTVKQRLQEDLEREQQTLENTFLLNPLAMAIYDDAGGFIRANKAFHEVFRSEPPPGYSLFDDPLLIENGMGGLLERMKCGEVVFLPALWYNPHLIDASVPDTPVLIKALSFPVFRLDGTIEYHVLMLENLTDTTLRERALKLSERRFAEFAELLPMAAFELDLKGRLVYANSKAMSWTGYTPSDLESGLNVSDLVVEADRVRLMTNISAIMAGQPSLGFEYAIRRRDGSSFPAIIFSTVIMSGNAPAGLRGVAMDISERKELEKKLARFEKVETTGMIAAGLAHDIRNLLSMIMTPINLLRQLAGDNRNIADIASCVEDSLDRLSQMTDKLHAIGQRTQPNLERAGANSVVSAALKNVETLLPPAVRFETNLCAGDPTINCDQVQVQQALLNLIFNARDAVSGSGSISVSTRLVRVRERNPARDSKCTEGQWVVISVRDTGAGIPEDIRNRLFDPLFTTKKKGSGHGLGLTLVNRIVQKHGGSVDFESAVGKGSEFRIHLPVVV